MVPYQNPLFFCTIIFHLFSVKSLIRYIIQLSKEHMFRREPLLMLRTGWDKIEGKFLSRISDKAAESYVFKL